MRNAEEWADHYFEEAQTDWQQYEQISEEMSPEAIQECCLTVIAASLLSIAASLAKHEAWHET